MKRTVPDRLTPNIEKIIASVSYVIAEAQRRGETCTQYDIVKSLFLADKRHLNKFGRPITFDNYVAMKDGPVPSLSYNFIKEDKSTLSRHNVRLPWARTPTPKLGTRVYTYTITGAENLDALAESDIEELNSALTVVKSLGFSQVRRLTHEEPGYIKARKHRGSSENPPMDYSLLFEQPDFDPREKAAELAFFSKHS